MNNLDLINLAIGKGAVLCASVSGGKDGQAMAKIIHNAGLPIYSLLHADLGRVEWKESLPQCQIQSKELNVPLRVVQRRDGLDLLAYWQRRMEKLKGTGKPFWSSSKARYCQSDLKRLPMNQYFISLDSNLIISCEGIRAQESKERSKKTPLSIRPNVTSSYYKGMTVEQALRNYNPEKRLVLTWYAIFEYTLDQVWASYGMTKELLETARLIYKQTGNLVSWWPFHPAYVYGNDRVSCMFCILGSLNDLKNGANHNLPLLKEMISMEDESGATFKNNWSLKQLL